MKYRIMCCFICGLFPTPDATCYSNRRNVPIVAFIPLTNSLQKLEWCETYDFLSCAQTVTGY